jgi:hypothetical protein
MEPYLVNGKLYSIDGANNIKEALGFIKDWVTALIQLQTAAIAAIGAFSGFDVPQLSLLEAVLIGLTVIALGLSIGVGSILLNMLPGCVQRKPEDDHAKGSDIYSIGIFRGGPARTLGFATSWFGWSFRWAIAFFLVFILVRVTRLMHGLY